MSTEQDVIVERAERARRVRSEMGGAERLARMKANGDRTIREHIEGLVDKVPAGEGPEGGASSFRELGTFARSARFEDRHTTPGDGKIGGHATIGGREVVVFGDDITVRRGSSSLVGSRKEVRLYERALAMGVPIVHFGETGGARIPDIMGAEGISEGGELFPTFATRRHQVPMATAIVGQSFGGSSFLSALSDFVVMVRGSCLAVTSPRVFEVATGEVITFEEVGGVDVHARTTGQIDLGVDTDEEAYEAIRRWLSYLPQNASERPPRTEPTASLAPDPGLAELVPAKRTRGYDMRRVVSRIADPDSVFELQPLYARSVVAALARLDGWPVAFVANNPMFNAGVLDPVACHKIIRLVTTCDAFQIPVIFLIDVPGFMVGRKVEHDLMLHWGMRMMQALHMATTPTLTVCIRKAFGLAWQAMNGAGQAALGLYVWPGAEIGFMDPEVGVNVLYGERMSKEEKAAMAAEIREGTSPYEAAGLMNLDEIIDPATTRQVLARDLNLLAGRRVPGLDERPLLGWPTC
jgi:acetyl-CoA carboxylase carboxyltransferase component